MLLGMDEYPYHQITATFAGVGGTDPAWNDGHYLCLSDMAGEVALASTLRLYQNNDVMDGFVCVRHAGKQHNIRVSRRLRPDMGTLAVGPLRLEIVEPLRSVRLVLEDNEHDISLDVTCRSTRAAVRGPGRSDARRRPADQRADHLRGDRQVRRVGAGRRRPRTAQPGNSTPSSATTRGATRPGAGVRGCTARRSSVCSVACRVCGNGCCSTCLITAGSGSSTQAGEARPARVRSCIRTGVCRSWTSRTSSSSTTVVAGSAAARCASPTPTALSASTRSRTLGWVYTQGGGYFGGFDDGLGQGVYRGDYHVEGEVWDVSHPTTIVDADGKAFEFDHAWAENFTRLTCDGARGLAHFECVVIQEAQGWTTHPGKASTGRRCDERRGESRSAT